MDRIHLIRATLLLIPGLLPGIPAGAGETGDSDLRWTAYRLREDFHADLNADFGWAAPENQPATLSYDAPFRLRIEVESGESAHPFQELRLQYRWRERDWQTIGVSQFPYPRFSTPPVSITSTSAYPHEAETEDLLRGSTRDHEEGMGLSLLPATPLFSFQEESTEWEWPLVIRRFSDGPTIAENHDAFHFRVVDGRGIPLEGLPPLTLFAVAEEGHLGGTFIETPARIGPYQSSRGNLYFLMEPTETDNRFMMVKSNDHGETWREVDGSHRPRVGDLEGVGSVLLDETIHILHQTSDAVYHHAFQTEDHSGQPDSWVIDSREIARPDEPPTQVAALVSRPDGSLVAAYGSPEKIMLQVRSPQGLWETPIEVGSDTLTGLSGCQLVSDDRGITYLTYTSANGDGWLQTLYRDGTLTRPHKIDSSLGTTDAENGAFLPPVVPDSGLPAILYRKEDGTLWERRVFQGDVLSSPVRISARKAVTNAVDAEQVGADVIAYKNQVHVLFIEEDSRAIYHTYSEKPGLWSEPKPVIAGVDACWVRGNLLQDAEGNPVYGFVTDAGSQGGSGMNRYHALPLQ